VIAPVLTTARLRLRPLSYDDRSLFHTLYCDADTMRHIGRPLTPARAAASLRATVDATREPDGPGFFVIVERRNRNSVGLCSIRSAADRRCREIGIMLVRGARQRGLATEALGALIDEAFDTLPIAAVSVQYRPANASMAGVCNALGFAPPIRPGKPGRRTRMLRRSQWRRRFHQPAKGKAMSNLIGFLENAGSNAALRHASREQLLRAMQLEEIAPAAQAALLKPSTSAIDGLFGARETMYCINQEIGPSKKKKAPAKKTPAKAPPKKTPAKKPAKKAPAKRKR